jgi:hypothetical protein
MTARTRKWVVLSALCLLSLDLALVAVAAPRARGWLESARTSALARAGTRGVENLSGALLARFTHRSTGVYAFILRTTPREAARAAAVQAPREASWVMVATPSVRAVEAMEAMEADCPSIGPTPSCPSSSCPSSNCPKTAAPKGAVSGSSATGLPISMLGMTLE